MPPTARPASDRNFELPPLGKAAIVFAWTLGAGVPLVVAAAMIFAARDGEISPLLLLGTQALIAVGVLIMILPLWRRRVAFDGRRLRVESTYYTRESLLPEFDLDAARVVDLRERKELQPLLKSNGYALPGFWSGHFRLRDWKLRAFCLVTDPAKVLVLPHADGRVWLLSFAHPQAVLDILRRAV